MIRTSSKRLLFSLVLVIAAQLAWASVASADDCGGLRNQIGDETLHILPTYGALTPDKKRVRVPIHAWVYEEEDGLMRKAAIEVLLEGIEVEEGSDAEAIFDRRAVDFMVDNESRKEVFVSIDAEWLPSPVVSRIGRTAGNGHIRNVVEIPFSGDPAQGGLLQISARLDDSEFERSFDALVIPPTGTSIVSDIDDTLKITGVLDKKELLANTFLREFEEAPGMADLMRRWARSGAAFHYVSASPWNLQCELHDFADRVGIPAGVYHLRVFRPKEIRRLIEFVKSSRDHKITSISELIGRFPDRRFVLVGDTGEADPEIYGELTRRFPKQIDRVLLRRVEGADNGDARFEAAFRDVEPKKWTVFAAADEVGP